MTKQHTDFIPYSSALNGFHARRYLVSSGGDFHIAVTVNWSLIGETSRSGVMVNRAFRTKLLRAWRYRIKRGDKGVPSPRYIEVVESPDGNFHSHLAINMPASEIDWVTETSEDRLIKMTGAHLPAKLLDVRLIETSGAFMKYLMKGVSPAYADHFFLDTAPQGTIFGRRVSCSTQIGPTARKEAGWKRR